MHPRPERVGAVCGKCPGLTRAGIAYGARPQPAGVDAMNSAGHRLTGMHATYGTYPGPCAWG